MTVNARFAWAAAAISLVTFVGHTFVGGPQVAKPILAAPDLTDLAKWLGYFCWHVTTLLVLMSAAGFVYGALHPGRPELVVFLTILSGLIWVLSLGITVTGMVGARRNPGVWLFGLITLVGIAALTL